nr:putative alpha/beta hydrolase [Ipomoea batatas]GME15565.1 putative alpha/beta hydrolase [Ipomoea batatas]
MTPPPPTPSNLLAWDRDHPSNTPQMFAQPHSHERDHLKPPFPSEAPSSNLRRDRKSPQRPSNRKKLSIKPSVPTVDELHYIFANNSEWRLALWQYIPPPQVQIHH